MQGQLIKLGQYNTNISTGFEILCDEASLSNKKIANICHVTIENVKDWKNMNSPLTPNWIHLLVLSRTTDINFASRYTRLINIL